MGLFASLDVVLFYIFFEFTLIPLFFLIGLWGGPQRQRASIMFFLYTLAGSLLTLLGVIALVVVHYRYSPANVLTFSIPELTRGLATLPWPRWHEVGSWSSPQVLIFLLLLAGFAIKVPMFPFHTWLPLAHVEAPTAGSIILAGVLLKVGSYGLLRFNMGMTPLGAVSLFPLLATLAVIGIIYGALVALAQTDMKRLVAYSSVSHMGFVVLGMFALNSTGLDGSVIQMVNHGLTTGALFACVGVLYERYHTREMSEVGGIWNRLPILAFFFILSALGSAALPGLNGFVGEFPILVGMFSESRRAAVLGGTGMILGACYLLWMIRKVVFGPLREPADHEHAGGGNDHAAVRPVGWHEIAGLAPLMALIVLIGVVPGPFLDRIRPSVGEIDKNLQSQRGSMTLAVATTTSPSGTSSPRRGMHPELPRENVDEPSDRIRIGPSDAPDLDPGVHRAGGRRRHDDRGTVLPLAAADVVRDRGRGAGRGLAGAAGGLGLALADRHVRLGCPQRLAGVLRPPCGPAQRPDPAGPGPRRAGR